MVIDLGTVLLGVAALVTAVGGVVLSLSANRRSKRAEALSTTASLIALREEADRLAAAVKVQGRRWGEERSELEASRANWRRRAEDAEMAKIDLHGEIVAVRADLVEAQRQIAELRARFEASITVTHDRRSEP